jgi:hypothetical protein
MVESGMDVRTLERLIARRPKADQRKLTMYALHRDGWTYRKIGLEFFISTDRARQLSQAGQRLCESYTRRTKRICEHLATAITAMQECDPFVRWLEGWSAGKDECANTAINSELSRFDG